jgi:Flp pilus assembly protein TadG
MMAEYALTLAVMVSAAVALPASSTREGRHRVGRLGRPTRPAGRVTMDARRQSDREQGQTIVEFAVVLPILAVLLFGILQFGIAFNNYLALTDAARAGARVAAVSRNVSNPVAAATTALRSAAADLNRSQLGVSVSSTWQPGSEVDVTATYPYSINLFGVVVKSGTLSTTMKERVE